MTIHVYEKTGSISFNDLWKWNLRKVLYREATRIVLVHFWYFYLSTKSLLHETVLWRDGLFLKHANPTLIYDQKLRMYMSTSVFAIHSNIRTQKSIIVKLGQTQNNDWFNQNITNFRTLFELLITHSSYVFVTIYC